MYTSVTSVVKFSTLKREIVTSRQHSLSVTCHVCAREEKVRERERERENNRERERERKRGGGYKGKRGRERKGRRDSVPEIERDLRVTAVAALSPRLH